MSTDEIWLDGEGEAELRPGGGVLALLNSLDGFRPWARQAPMTDQT
ncbi:hypothetical protein [Nocardia pseudobrasiliensis]|nr:hypothetical protein [Nocardia pseudobrasiliensis]